MWPIREINKRIREKPWRDGPYSVILLDIDFFTRIFRAFNDTEVKDIIDNIGSFFREELPGNAAVYRSEGDEYLILWFGKDKNNSESLMKEIKKKFRKQKFAANSSRVYWNIPISFSAGVSSFPLDGEDLDVLIRRATVALFQAKALRRNRIVKAPDEKAKGLSRVLFDETLEVNVVLGKYGVIGSINEEIPKADAFLWEPQAIDMDEEGNLYIVDQNNHAVLRYNGQTAVRIVGNGAFGYSGDKGPAIHAALNKPTGLAVHKSTIYITDTGNDVVRRYDLDSGVIDTVAGTGKTGYSGDGGPASEARLNKPGGAATDGRGNLYINDIANNVIRKVDRQGIITTYAGTGEYGYGGDGGSAVNASFSEIYGLAIDKKNDDLYLADYFNHCVRKIDSKTGTISTVAGNGQEGYVGDNGPMRSACLSRPVAVHIDAYNNLYIAESGNSCVRLMHSSSPEAYTLVGDGVMGIGESGPVNNFRLANPNGIVRGPSNKLYILDGANNRVCAINLRRWKDNGRDLEY